LAIRRFEDLEVWQTARELVRGVYRAAQSQPLRHDYAMANQIKRAAISVASNIAEGFERGSRKQQIEACYLAKGSAGEVRCQVLLARDVELLGPEAAEWLLETCDKCSRMLANYLRYLQQTSRKFPGVKVVGQQIAEETP
jgi:four helix bundle protein